MTVLIDQPMWPAHDTLWSHLVSDESLDELHAFAAAQELPRRAFDLDHYDVPARRYADLVRAGAVAVSGRELVLALRASGLRVSQKERRSRPGAGAQPSGVVVTVPPEDARREVRARP